MVAVLGLLGCGAIEDAGASTDDFIDMDTPPGNCSAETGAAPCPDPGASTGVPEGGACLESNDCAAGTYCIAPFHDGEVGDFTCTAQCIPLMDELSWCLDASACCDVGAACNSRGLCIDGGLDDSGTATDSGTGTEGTGTSSSGGSTAGSESTGTGTGTDTGASTGTTGAMES